MKIDRIQGLLSYKHIQEGVCHDLGVMASSDLLKQGDIYAGVTIFEKHTSIKILKLSEYEEYILDSSE